MAPPYVFLNQKKCKIIFFCQVPFWPQCRRRISHMQVCCNSMLLTCSRMLLHTLLKMFHFFWSPNTLIARKILVNDGIRSFHTPNFHFLLIKISLVNTFAKKMVECPLQYFLLKKFLIYLIYKRWIYKKNKTLQHNNSYCWCWGEKGLARGGRELRTEIKQGLT